MSHQYLHVSVLKIIFSADFLVANQANCPQFSVVKDTKSCPQDQGI